MVPDMVVNGLVVLKGEHVNVLSLFDGISCAQVAIARNGIKIDNYFSSEINKNAIRVTQQNYPNTIQVGNILTLKSSNLPKIDIIIGGSPCQGFSIAGKRMNFHDERSALFFQFVRLLDECKPKYFLLENVKMKLEHQKIISKSLGVTPVLINSGLVSKQNRERLYWTNINIPKLHDKNNNFDNYLYRLGHGLVKDEIKFFKKYPALAAQWPATKYRLVTNLVEAKSAFENKDILKLRRDKNITRSLTPEECEELQTLPVGYTKMLKNTQRYATIGNGFTVDVIYNILTGIQ